MKRRYWRTASNHKRKSYVYLAYRKLAQVERTFSVQDANISDKRVIFNERVKDVDPSYYRRERCVVINPFDPWLCFISSYLHMCVTYICIVRMFKQLPCPGTFYVLFFVQHGEDAFFHSLKKLVNCVKTRLFTKVCHSSSFMFFLSNDFVCLFCYYHFKIIPR